MTRQTDNTYMQLALRLAAQGELTCAPNPQVGCVIVKQGQIVGQGYHHQAGTPHAEVHALRQAGSHAEGADVYVTLEPCSHTGRTPPCVDALIAAKVRRVIIPFYDPNPRVLGQGVAKLNAAGILVDIGIGADAAVWQNRLFLTPHITHRPYVIAKWAMTTDGALTHPTQRWISNASAREHAHQWRQRIDAICVGQQTVIDDNPSLTNRTTAVTETERRHPLRLILSQANAIPTHDNQQQPLKLSHAGLPGQTWWLSPAPVAAPVSHLYLPDMLCWQLPSQSPYIELPTLLAFLAEQGVASLLVEGGSHTLQRFFEAGLVDEAHVYLDTPDSNTLPWPTNCFWQPLKQFTQRTAVTLADNTWLQYVPVQPEDTDFVGAKNLLPLSVGAALKSTGETFFAPTKGDSSCSVV